MTLNDLRKYAIRQQTAIRYPLANGMECVIDTHGVARVPGWRESSGLNLEHELSQASTFTLEDAQSSRKRLTREQLRGLAASGKTTEAAHGDEDES